MANLSNINGKFVVEQTTGYVGVGTTDPNYPIEVLNASAEIALNASGGSIYRLKSDSTDAFRINKNGVGDRLIIAGGGAATFSGNVGVAGKTPAFGLSLGQGTGAGNKIAWTDVTPHFAASIYASSSTDKLTFATKNASNAETTALEIDTSQNATFAGSVFLDQYLKISSTTAQYAYQNFGADAGYGWQIGKAPASGGVVGAQGFYLYNLSTSTVALGVDTSNNATFAGNVVLSNGALTIYESAATSPAISATSGWGGGVSNPIINFGRTGSAVAGSIGYDDPDTDLYIGTTTNHSFKIRTNNTDKVIILNTGNVGIGAAAPRDKLTVFTTGSSEEEIGLRLVNPIGFTNAGSGASIMFAQDRSQTENLPMAKIRSSQTAGGTSCCGDLIFSTMHTGVGGMVDKMIITSTGGIAFGSTRNNYGTSGEVLISNGSVSPSWGTATSVSEDNYWKIDDGLNFHLAFKEGSGTTVADIGGGRNDFTGTATWTQTGRFGYALDFNGTSQYLGGGTSPSSNVTTFSAWINNDGGGGIQNIVSGSYIMGYVSVYSNQFQIYDGVGWRNAGAVPLNEWVHVAFSYDASGNAGGLQKMYINGVLGYSATAIGYTGVASSITHVGMYAGAIRYFNGEITNIQTWDRILGDSEIQSLYNKYSGYGGSVSEASLWTLKPLAGNILVNGNIAITAFTHAYTYPAPHALYISGGVTTTPASSGVSYSAHFTIKVDNADVGLVDQHETPPEWWRQSWAFMTPNYTSGSHTITFNALNQHGNFNMIGGAVYSQIVYRIIPL